LYRVGHCNPSTLITGKESIFPEKDKTRQARKGSCIILTAEEVNDLEFDLETIFQGHL